MSRWTKSLTAGLLAATVALPVLLTAGPVGAFQKPAAGQKPPAGQKGQRAGGGLARIAEKLNLTPEQKTKVEALLKEQRDDRQKLRDLPPAERREKARANAQAFRSKLNAILTPEQQAKAKEEMAKLRKERGGAAGNRPKPGKEAKPGA
ncbi:MAG: hypothetical protein FJX77_16405 [Armatimonadetes bacterium]|nr:hypothetical protein [Armatimonadota bacterium]